MKNQLYVFDAVITTDAMHAHPVGVVAESPIKARRLIRNYYLPQTIVFIDCFRCLGKASRPAPLYVTYNPYAYLDTKDR